ncbi:hypothetical protein HYDPIDRAFT_29734 [Hydnomerulius pinastri MD-312]|uniref:Unplaced genomic scaffold scaffold_18, whole genome shotgun sequence n=1 Tax=Hydnomerulius pinastri MD-312 TaxID=994086 RepID=A0A0C9VBJ9_9AGAM|nr:hypothetical protein HYDPIDRAFT_29734 [Hydnomerulius pinastri MD-312]
MPLQQVALRLFFVCSCLQLATSASATAGPAHNHEARQGGPVSISPPTVAPGPVSLPPQTPSSTPSSMPPTSSEPSSPSSSTNSPLPSSPGNPASPSSSGSPASPSSSPSFSFNQVQNMTTCTTGLITWNYSGQQAELTLSVTDQVATTARYIGRRQNTGGLPISQLLTETNAQLGSYTWQSVNLTEGQYYIQAYMPSFAFSSSSLTFYITNGSDVSCLTGTSPHSTAPAPSGNPSTSPSSASSKNNTGAIVGGVLGAIAGVALVVLAGLLYLRRRRRSSARGGSMKRRSGRWGSLTSNSSIKPGGSTRDLANDHYDGYSASTGGMLQGVAGGKASATTTPGGSDADVTTMGEDKVVSPRSPPGMNPFEILDSPFQSGRRASIYSLQGPAAIAESSRSRTTSVRTSNHSLEQQAHRIRSSMESSMYLRTERLSMPILPATSLPRTPTSPARSREEYPLSPITPSPVNRSASAGAGSVTRRTPRKPVPQYDPSELREDSASTAQDTVSTFAAESSHSHGTGTGTETHGQPELAHKSSFGSGRPVHYLIPDMPPPPRD